MHLVSESRPPVRDTFMRLHQVEQVTGLKKSTLYRLMREKKFVQAVQITPRCTAWPASKVYEWVQERIAAAAGDGQAAA